MENIVSHDLSGMILEISPMSKSSNSIRWLGCLILVNAILAWSVLSPSSVWLGVLYCTLLVHTAVEAPFFTPLLTTKSSVLKILTFALFVVYGLLAWSLDTPTYFFAQLMLLFIFAAIGYARLFQITGRKKFQKKIYIDGAGAFMALMALGAIALGRETPVVPVVTLLYIAVTVWMLWIRPYYRE